MLDKKKDFTGLTEDELREVKGGIPYETPGLFEMSATTTSCTVGKHCDKGLNGGQSCASGLVCSSGIHTGGGGGDPDTDPSPV